MRALRFFSPFLYGISPAFFLIAENFKEVIPGEVFSVISGLLFLTGILYLILSAALKDSARAALHLCFFLLLFFSFGHFCNVISSILPQEWGGAYTPGPIHFVSLLFFAVIFILGAWGIQKLKPHALEKTGEVAAVFMFIVLMFSLTNIAVKWQDNRVLSEKVKVISESHDLKSDAQDKPDIYYVILDSYSGDRTLRENYGFDNREMLDFLREKGFRVQSPAYSNYQSTTKSLASFLNGRYLDDLAREYGLPFDAEIPLFSMIQDNYLMHYLKSNGYKIVYFRSPFSIVDELALADVQINCTFRRNLLLELSRTSMMVFFKPFLFKWIQEDFKRGFLKTYAELKEVPNVPGPKFVFAHIVSPHPPYLFDKDGVRDAKRLLLTGIPDDDREKFIGQLQFVNRQMKDVISSILDKTQGKAVIVIHADHGAPIQPAYFKGEREDLFRGHLEILNAVYFPDQQYADFYETLSLVNLPRVILNRYFHAGLELQPDHGYYSEDAKNWHEHKVSFDNREAA